MSHTSTLTPPPIFRMERALAHPVLAAPALDSSGPVAIRLLGEDWVLWRGTDGQAWGAPDRCPHRGTRLSLGRVCEGELECPYHGWRFGTQGRCTAMPAAPGFVPGDSHGLAARALHEAAGLLWLTPEGDAPPPVIVAEAEPRLRKLTVGPYDVATSAPRLVENFLDMAHFSFVHEGWLGDRSHAAVPPYRVEVDPAAGVRAFGCQAWQPRSNLHSTEGSWVAYDYHVPAPYLAILEKAPDAQAGWRESIALLVCPVDEEHCRVWFRLAVPDFDSPDAVLSAFQDTIFGQDRPILESQQPKRLPLHGEVHGAADRLSTAYRRWLGECRVRFGLIV